ncbi:MAG TPA: hypothetical protein VHO66_05280 [Ruminiclostridium sp.]|nr:hypothetical protein [Ruminiclostridium sp.]
MQAENVFAVILTGIAANTFLKIQEIVSGRILLIRHGLGAVFYMAAGLCRAAEVLMTLMMNDIMKMNITAVDANIPIDKTCLSGNV